MERNFKIGEIVRIDMKTAFYQLVAERNADQVYVRQVFDKKLNFKLGKAVLYHRNWLCNVSKVYKLKLAALLEENPEIKKQMDDLTFDPAFGYFNWVPMLYYIKDADLSALQKRLDEELEREPMERKNDKLTCLLEEFEKRKYIEPTGTIYCQKRKEDESIYRVECGRYESDFDKNGNETFRCARFYRVKCFDK